METEAIQRIKVMTHRVDRWLDRPNGIAATLCGLVVQAKKTQQAIDQCEVVSEISCPLCECAEMLKDVELPPYEQPALF